MFLMNGKPDIVFCAASGLLRGYLILSLYAFLQCASFYSSANNAVTTTEKLQSTPVDGRFKEAAAALKKLDIETALKLARAIMAENAEYSDTWHRGAEILSQANTIIYCNPKIPAPEKSEYVVRQGDTLGLLAKDFGVTVGAICKNNNLPADTSMIPVGKKLFVYNSKWDIKVKKKSCRLYLYNKGELFKVYPVTVGRNGKTPSGTFEIASKVYEPDWTREGKIIPYGTPENPLGTRWMNLRPIGETDPKLSGYGLHGSWRPERIGRAESNGCVRMKNADVEEIFEIVPYKTPLTIEE